MDSKNDRLQRLLGVAENGLHLFWIHNFTRVSCSLKVGGLQHGPFDRVHDDRFSHLP
jgi:hypothetical protein